MLLVIILIVFLLWQCRGGSTRVLGGTQPPNELSASLPNSWQVLPEYPKAVTLENNDKQQWLYLYRYDAAGGRTQIGGVIYSPQSNPEPFKLGIPINAVPSAFLVPYPLLPDVTTGKGQGYLGDVDAMPSVVNTTNGKELLVRGNDYGLITRVSVFWWMDAAKGYGAAHIAASGGFDDPLTGTTNNPGLAAEIRGKERLYDRDNLCRVRTYRRNDQTRQFTASDPRLSFCGDAPPDSPFYPEGAVLAYLLQVGTPQAGKFLTDTATSDIATLQSNGTLPNRADGLTITGLSYPGSVDPQIQNRETVEVISDFFANGVPRRVTWSLVRYPATSPAQTPRWYIRAARAA